MCFGNLNSNCFQCTMSKNLLEKTLYKMLKRKTMSLTKRLVYSVSVNIRISHPSKIMFTVLGLTNPDANLKRKH